MAEFSILSSFTSYRIKCPMCQSLWQTVGVGRLGVAVVGCTASVLQGKMLIYSAFRRRHRRRCSFVSCFQWIVNKQRLLSLQRPDGRLVSVLVSAAVSAIPIPNRYHWYRPDTDTEYWYRSKPKRNTWDPRATWVVVRPLTDQCLLGHARWPYNDHLADDWNKSKI